MLRLAAFITAFVLSLLVLSCADDAASEPSPERPRVPTPVASLNREDCDVIGATDRFISDDEQQWYTENCNRLDCDEIRGTQYLARVERTWYLNECL